MNIIKGGVKMPQYVSGNIRLQSGRIAPAVGRMIIVSPDENHDAFSHFTVEGVTADIDPNIIPENIRKNINILGCDGDYGGEYQEKSVTPSGSQQEVTPDSGYYGLSKVNVRPVALAHLTALPQTSDRTVRPGTGFSGLLALTVEGVTAAVDPDIKPDNIRYGVSILGVDGAVKSGINNIYPYANVRTVTASNIKNMITSVRLPAGITSIGERMFSTASLLKSVSLPETVTVIKKYAFSNSSIERIYIPASVTSIETEAFYSCTALYKDGVYYGGTEEQWNAINIDNTANRNTLLLSAPRYYDRTGLPES